VRLFVLPFITGPLANDCCGFFLGRKIINFVGQLKDQIWDKT